MSEIEVVREGFVFFGDLKSAAGVESEDLENAGVRKGEGKNPGVVDAVEARDDDEEN